MPARLILDQHLTVKMAAEFIGISPSMLRNRDGADKLESHRNPMK